ncbi:MAG TPA: DUF2961 domain-containing protein [Candidatus Brocadiia bacterium]|nr:DUF2961 domain-containing protein [Candidatus Brocadiia bacterium]
MTRRILAAIVCLTLAACASVTPPPPYAPPPPPPVPPGIGSLDDLTLQQDYEAYSASSCNEDLKGNGDCRSIPAGGTLVLADLEGPGMITQFWHTVGTKDIFYGRSIILRIYYDGAEKPSVLAPIGDFFGIGHGGVYKNFVSAPVIVNGHGKSRTCFWKMPFRKSIKITVTNDSSIPTDSFYFHINWRKYESLPDDAAYFHAKYRQEFPAQPGNFVLLSTEGRGHYVGTVHSVHQVEMGWYGEGDEFFTVDGAEKPQLRGTGTEDYFLDAWGTREFHTPYAGVPLYEGVMPGDRVTAYRWHIPDPIPFKKSLRVEIEHKGSVFNEKGTFLNFDLGGFIERPDWVSSVAFWYQTPAAGLEEDIAPVEKRIPPFKILDPGKMKYRANPPLIVVPGDLGLAYIPGMQGASLEFDFEVEKDGRYQISAVAFYGIVCGIYQPYLDGKKIGGPVDFVICNFTPDILSLDTHDLKAGKHTLRFEGIKEESPNARNTAPKFYALAVARLLLLRLEDMEGYHETSARLLKTKK